MRDETLVEILKGNSSHSPDILLEEDGDICLDWSNNLSVSIGPDGSIAWAFCDGRHGTSLPEFLQILAGYHDWKQSHA